MRYHALSLPKGPIQRGAREVHGIGREDLRREGARPWPEVHPELVTVLADATCVVGWNVAFDRRLLEQTATRHGLALPDVAYRDLLADYRALRSGVPGRHTLGAVCEREGVKAGAAHRAEADCRAVLAIMRTVAKTG